MLCIMGQSELLIIMVGEMLRPQCESKEYVERASKLRGDVMGKGRGLKKPSNQSL